MAIFATGVATQVQNALGTGTGSSNPIFDPNSTALAALSPAVTLHDITIVNTGSTTIFVGQSGVTASTGLPLLAGQQLTIQGWSAVTGTTTARIYGITSSGTGTTEAGLASFPSVV